MIYDPYSREMQEDPFPSYAHFLEKEPCHYNPKMDFYALFRFEDIWEATLDWKTFSSRLGPSLETRTEPPPERVPSIIGMDPPRQVRIRNLLAKGFTPQRIAALEPEVRRIARTYLDTYVNSALLSWVRSDGADMGDVGRRRESPLVVARYVLHRRAILPAQATVVTDI